MASTAIDRFFDDLLLEGLLSECLGLALTLIDCVEGLLVELLSADSLGFSSTLIDRFEVLLRVFAAELFSLSLSSLISIRGGCLCPCWACELDPLTVVLSRDFGLAMTTYRYFMECRIVYGFV